MARRRDELVAEHGAVPPPWAMFDYHPYSMGWRMGAGETHAQLWWAWWSLQKFSQEQMVDYFRRWPPPHCWLAAVIQAIWDIDVFDEERQLAPFFERLASWGFGTQRDYELDLEDPAWLDE